MFEKKNINECRMRVFIFSEKPFLYTLHSNLLDSSTCVEHYCAHLQEDLIVSIQHLVPDPFTLTLM